MRQCIVYNDTLTHLMSQCIGIHDTLTHPMSQCIGIRDTMAHRMSQCIAPADTLTHMMSQCIGIHDTTAHLMLQCIAPDDTLTCPISRCIGIHDTTAHLMLQCIVPAIIFAPSDPWATKAVNPKSWLWTAQRLSLTNGWSIRPIGSSIRGVEAEKCKPNSIQNLFLNTMTWVCLSVAIQQVWWNPSSGNDDLMDFIKSDVPVSKFDEIHQTAMTIWWISSKVMCLSTTLSLIPWSSWTQRLQTPWCLRSCVTQAAQP